MADIKWIKLYTNMPDNRKIKRIRKLPDGNNVILFWVFLLSRAGETNQSGALFFTDNVPYTEEDLAADFDFSTEFVRFALITLEKYRMIERYESIIFIKNWDEYQQKDKLEKIQEQNRIRQANYRQKQKELANSNVSVTLPVTESNAVELEQELEQELELEQEKDIEQKQQPSLSNKLLESDFEEIWKLYPNKKGKAKSLKKYKKEIKDKTATHEEIKKGVEAYAAYVKKERTEKQFQKHGSTFFNERAWEDDYASNIDYNDTYKRTEEIDYGF